jgi:hypothetical protein
MTLFRASLGFAVLVLCAVPLLVYSGPPQRATAAVGTLTSGRVNLTFTPIDVPGSNYTGVWGINSNGDMVGNYGQNIESDSHGFLYSNGTFTSFDYPGQPKTVAYGINDSGLIVGSAGDLYYNGFLYDGRNFTTINHGNASTTYVNGVNNGSLVVGGFGDPGATRGFEMRGQQFKTISPPPGGWIYVEATGINNLGEVVGWTDGATNTAFSLQGGTYQTISLGNYGKTEAYGVNDEGIIVGWYEDCTPSCFIHGFAYKHGRYVRIDYPGASGTFALRISNIGVIVGEYQLADGSLHGFVTSPISNWIWSDLGLPRLR